VSTRAVTEEPEYLQEKQPKTSEAALGRAKPALRLSEAGLSCRLQALLRPEPQGQQGRGPGDKTLACTSVFKIHVG